MKSARGAAWLEAARRERPPADLEGAVLGALGLAAAGAAVVAPSLAARLWEALKHAAASKVGAGVVVAAVAASGGYAAGRAEVPAPPPPHDLARAAVDVATPRRVAALAPPPTTAPPSASVPPASMPTPRRLPALVAPRRAPAAPHANAHSTLAREIAALRLARARLLSGDGSGALAALDAYDAETPRGELREEALALRVRASRLAGDDAGAERALAALTAEFPGSIQLRALRR